MVRRLALKRLSASDLSLFAHHLKKSKQKAINLNASPFTTVFYPGLKDAGSEAKAAYKVDLNVFGPGLHGGHRIVRKVTKTPGGKNWRLNGEFIEDGHIPPAGRVHEMVKGDLALLEFHGDLRPETIDLYLIQASNAVDSGIHPAFDAILGSKSLIPVTVAQVLEVLDEAGAAVNHPIRSIATAGDDVEQEVAVPGKRFQPYVVGQMTGQTAEQLEQAGKNRTEVGVRGEKWFNKKCTSWKASGAFQDYIWVAKQDPTAPFDFLLVFGPGDELRVDVKSTDAAFSSAFFVSGKETEEMARAGVPYRICRLGRLSSPDGPEWRFTTDLQAFAGKLWEALDEALPDEVGIKSLSWRPDGLPWDDGFLAD